MINKYSLIKCVLALTLLISNSGKTAEFASQTDTFYKWLSKAHPSFDFTNHLTLLSGNVVGSKTECVLNFSAPREVGDSSMISMWADESNPTASTASPISVNFIAIEKGFKNPSWSKTVFFYSYFEATKTDSGEITAVSARINTPNIDQRPELSKIVIVPGKKYPKKISIFKSFLGEETLECENFKE